MTSSDDVTVWLGAIWTGHRDSDALAASGGRIVALGEDARALSQEAAEVLEVSHGVVMASFADGHAHPMSGGLEFQGPSIRAARQPEEVVGSVRRWAAENPDAEWIVGGSYDPSIAERGEFDARWLDAAVPDRPVVLRANDYHTVWVNSAALARAAITAESPDPVGGEIVRRADGMPLGTLREPGAVDLVLDMVPPPTVADRVRALHEAAALYAEAGLTWCQDAWVEPDMVPAFLEAVGQGDVRMRYNLALRADPESWRDQVDAFAELRRTVRDGADPALLTANTVKFFADGVIEGGTAELLEPYIDNPHSCGMAMWPPQELADAALAFDREQFQLHIHAIGDAAIRNSLDAVEGVRAGGMRDRRPVIAHTQLVDAADIPRFAALGVIANFEPYWAQLDPLQVDLSIPRLGPQRSSAQYPMATLLRHGTNVSFGSDWPVSSHRPLDGIQVAVTRRTLDETEAGGWLPEERLSAEQALRAYTAGVAYQAFAEDQWGTIRPGANADLVWLSQDPRHVDPMSIRNIQVLGTWLGGRSTHAM